MTTISNVINHFGDLLHTRLNKGVITTEDSVRYTFFAALLEAGRVKPENVILEFPHPAIKRARIDTWIMSLNNKAIAVEFKYFRAIPSGKNSPRPMKAGHFLHDIKRMSIIQDTSITKLCILLTDNEMASYFKNKNNGLYDFYSLLPHKSMLIDEALFENKSDTFVKAAGGIFNANIECLYSHKMPQSHELIIYKIELQ